MKVFLKRIINLIKPYILLETLGAILTVLYTLAVFASPIVSKYLIDEVIPTKSSYKLYVGLGIFLAVCILQPIFGYFKDLIFLNITESVTLNIRKKLFLRVINAPLKFFDTTNKGEIISRIINDGRGASEFITNFFVVFVKNIILIFMILVGMFYLSTAITGIVIVLFLVFFILNWRLSRRFSGLQAELQKNYDFICTTVNQMADSVATIKSFLVEEKITEKYNQVITKAYKDNKRIGYLNILLNNLTNVIVIISLVVIYGVGTLSVMSDKMTLGTVIAMGLYFQLLVQPVYELLNNNIQFRKTMPIFDRLYEYFNIENESYKDDQVPLMGEISVEGLYFGYNDNNFVLDDLNLKIEKNKLIALVGSSGSGKSTFVKLLLGFYRPGLGKIKIGDKDILEIGVNILRENISFVPQDIELFNTSIKENILCGKPNASLDEIIDICKRLRLHEKISSLPDGYNSIVSERVNLSGGEKQRIAIARALIKQPQIFILDEPTSSLDPENETILREILEALSKKCTVIVIAHKMTTITNADKIFVFENGKIVEQGTHSSLLNESGIYLNFVHNNEI